MNKYSNLLHARWNWLKDEIEKLKPLAYDNPTMILRIRKLKDEASVMRFAIEDSELFGYDQEEVLSRMIENRSMYNTLWNNYEEA